jgi:predicted transcriptional regulator
MLSSYKSKAPTRNSKVTSNQLTKSFIASKGSDSHSAMGTRSKANEVKQSKTPSQAVNLKASYSSLNPNLRSSTGATPTKYQGKQSIPQDL